MPENMSDKMSTKNSPYFFHTEEVKGLIKERGGLEAVAVKVQTTVRTLYRTIYNQSRNGRLQRDLLKFLRKPPTEVGEFRVANKDRAVKSKRKTVRAPRLSSSTASQGDAAVTLAASQEQA